MCYSTGSYFRSVSKHVLEDRFLAILAHVLVDLLADSPELSSLPKFNSMADRHLFNLSTQTVMQLVTQNQASFRVFVLSLSDSKRAKLERALKSLSITGETSVISGTSKPEGKLNPSGISQAPLANSSPLPKIQLKNFGNFESQ